MQGGVSSAPQISAGRRAPSASANLDEPVMGEQHNHPLPEGHGSCQPSTEVVGFFITSVPISCSRLVLTTLAFIVPQSVLNLANHSFGESPYAVLMLLLHQFNSCDKGTAPPPHLVVFRDFFGEGGWGGKDLS